MSLTSHYRHTKKLMMNHGKQEGYENLLQTKTIAQNECFLYMDIEVVKGE